MKRRSMEPEVGAWSLQSMNATGRCAACCARCAQMMMMQPGGMPVPFVPPPGAGKPGGGSDDGRDD